MSFLKQMFQDTAVPALVFFLITEKFIGFLNYIFKVEVYQNDA
jgi:hypothetical protein